MLVLPRSWARRDKEDKLPFDLTHICERCRRFAPLFYVKSVDEYLCEDCIMLLAKEQPNDDSQEDN